MAKTRADLQTQLDQLAKQTPGIVRANPEDGDFWSNFACASDFIVDDAGADDYVWVLTQIDEILKANGRMPDELGPSDDLPPPCPQIARELTMTTPTDEGLRRYPATQGYHCDISQEELAADFDNPCTCSPACPRRCVGLCGCEACSLSYTIFADESGYLSEYLMPAEQEAEIVAIYQAL